MSASQPPTTPPKVIVPKPLPWHQKLLATLAAWLIRGIAFTLRSRWIDESSLKLGSSEQRCIFCIWHNRLALCMIIYEKFVKRDSPTRTMAAIVSASRDGSIVARVLEHFKVIPVRGSSSRRGPQALKELVSAIKKGHYVAITPDGPRGPCYKVQEGPIALAQLTGLPIVPVSYHLSWKITLKSWDRFQIPLPFAKWTAHAGKEIYVPREASPEMRESLRLQVEQRLLELTKD